MLRRHFLRLQDRVEGGGQNGTLNTAEGGGDKLIEGDEDSFASAFGSFEGCEMTQEQRERDREMLNRIEREMEEDKRNVEAGRNEVGDAAGEGGDKLFVVNPPVQRPVVENTCRGCGRVAGPAHKCDICGSNMHPFCGRPIGEEGYRQKICCRYCDTNN